MNDQTYNTALRWITIIAMGGAVAAALTALVQQWIRLF